MELNVFMKDLEDALIKRGISPDVAEKHVHTLQRTFTDDDLREIKNINSPDEVEEIAESIATLLKKNKIKARSTQTPPPAPSAPPMREEAAKAQEEEEPLQPKSAPRPAAPTYDPPRRRNRTTRTPDPIYLDEDEYYDEYKVKKSDKGFYIFWLGFILTLPITIALGAALFGLFIGVFVALSALIVGLVAGLIGLVAVGAGVSLVGIIFGITQLFSFMAAGLYEIGLGVIVIGAVMLVSILLYNIAIRFLPWIIRLVASLLRFTCGKIRDLFVFVRRECYKL